MTRCETQSTLSPCHRWHHRLTPGNLVMALLVVEVLLCLSARYRWFAFNRHHGWTVLVTVAAAAAVMLALLFWFAVSLFFRRRFQFSIRSLLLLTVAVAIPCSWLMQATREAKRQREAVAAIRRLGYVVYDWQCDCDGHVMPITEEPKAPAWLWHGLGVDFFSEATDVNMFWPTDADLRPLEGIAGIQNLHFGVRDRITDDSLFGRWRCRRVQENREIAKTRKAKGASGYWNDSSPQFAGTSFNSRTTSATRPVCWLLQ